MKTKAAISSACNAGELSLPSPSSLWVPTLQQQSFASGITFWLPIKIRGCSENALVSRFWHGLPSLLAQPKCQPAGIRESAAEAAEAPRCHQPCSGERQAGVTCTQCQPSLGFQSVSKVSPLPPRRLCREALIGSGSGEGGEEQRKRQCISRGEKTTLWWRGKQSASGDSSCIICVLYSESRCWAGSLGNAGKSAAEEDSSPRRAAG